MGSESSFKFAGRTRGVGSAAAGDEFGSLLQLHVRVAMCQVLRTGGHLPARERGVAGHVYGSTQRTPGKDHGGARVDLFPDGVDDIAK